MPTRVVDVSSTGTEAATSLNGGVSSGSASWAPVMPSA
jgi:hypothetical protein